MIDIKIFEQPNGFISYTGFESMKRTKVLQFLNEIGDDNIISIIESRSAGTVTVYYKKQND